MRLAVEAVFYTCMTASAGIGWYYSFDTLRGPRGKWYIPRSSASFSIPQNARIVVRDIDSVAPWYIDKLGLRKSAESPWAEFGTATYRFKKDGKSITLTTNANYGTEKTLILLTKRISRMIKTGKSVRAACIFDFMVPHLLADGSFQSGLHTERSFYSVSPVQR